MHAQDRQQGRPATPAAQLDLAPLGGHPVVLVAQRTQRFVYRRGARLIADQGALLSGEVLLVAELRRMQDRVPAENLKPLALAAFKLIDQLNQGKNLKYPKRS
ncbi:hypothetical protein [Streptomyces sp. NPDC056682]|uniref:hypothetical protein n=1 Tax=Streptomyces sp. NPDC056682 TaxID=3345909 RepID=UPI0036AA8C69